MQRHTKLSDLSADEYLSCVPTGMMQFGVQKRGEESDSSCCHDVHFHEITQA